jgi:hypothetical protein
MTPNSSFALKISPTININTVKSEMQKLTMDNLKNIDFIGDSFSVFVSRGIFGAKRFLNCHTSALSIFQIAVQRKPVFRKRADMEFNSLFYVFQCLLLGFSLGNAAGKSWNSSNKIPILIFFKNYFYVHYSKNSFKSALL